MIHMSWLWSSEMITHVNWPSENMITHVNWLSENMKTYARMALLNGHLSIFACRRIFVTFNIISALGVLL